MPTRKFTTLMVRCVELDHCAEVVFPQSVIWKVPVKDDHLEELVLHGRPPLHTI
jgi:hypothetical protein